MESSVPPAIAQTITCSLGLSLLLLLSFVAGRLRRRHAPSHKAAQKPRPQPPNSAATLSPSRQPALQDPAPATAELPYRRQPQLLTPAERDFFAALRTAAPPDWHIFPQVRLANLVQVVPGTRGWKYHFGRVAQKCVDFVLCDPADMTPRLVIELDDSSHNRPDRKDRDTFVDGVLQSAGLPILHVRWQAWYNTGQLAEQIRRASGLSLPAVSPPDAPAIAPVQRWACRSCNAEVAETAKHCPACGRLLTA